MNRILVVLSLLILTAQSIFAATVTLPDAGSYSWWIRNASGSVSSAPHPISGTKTIRIPKEDASSGTLYILDMHTGGTAAIPLTGASVIAVTVDEFHSAAATSTVPTTSATPESTPVPSPQPTSSRGMSPIAQVGTFVLSLVLVAGVGWFVRAIYMSRGQLLIDAARRAGVDVPNPTDPIPSAVSEDGKYEPPPVKKVERIPEEAFKAARSTPKTGFLIAADGTSYGIGRKPLSIGRDAGNDIVLADTSVSRHHARVEPLSGGGVQIVDQGSSNGVFVNGQRVQTCVLEPGASLAIGHVPMKYEQ
jgi:hypothetical protein